MVPTEWTRVDSSDVRAVKWSDDGTLSVEYRSGGVYEFAGVTAAEATAIVHAPSVGRQLRATVAGIKGKRVDS